jgi:translation elongation factor EF-Tu-like GTPase
VVVFLNKVDVVAERELLDLEIRDLTIRQGFDSAVSSIERAALGRRGIGRPFWT